VGRRRPLVGLLVLLLVLALGGPARALDGERVDRAAQAVFEDPALKDGLEASHVEGITQGEVLAGGTQLLISALLQALRRWMKGNLVLAILIQIVLLGVLVLLLGHMGWSFRAMFRRGPRGAAADDPELSARRRRSDELRQEARRLAAAGQLREAERALLLAFLALLDERQLLGVTGAWTNREVLARLDVDPATRARLSGFVAAADAACYGDHGPTRDALAQGEALLDELSRGAPPARPAP
jgi:hypothetical protein